MAHQDWQSFKDCLSFNLIGASGLAVLQGLPVLYNGINAGAWE
jgi:hypothetical protein